MKVKTPEPAGFADFWAEWMPVCRDSDGRPKARKVYAEHILAGVNPEDILLAARWHIRKRRKENTLPYIQLASSWLNAERYEFEALEERKFQARLAESQAEREAKRTAPPPKPIIQPEQPSEDRAAIAKRMAEKFPMLRGMH